MRTARKTLHFLGLQTNLLTALTVIVLSVAFNATSPNAVDKQYDGQITEKGNPSTAFDSNKFGRSIVHQLVPHAPSLTDCHVEACIALTFDDGPEPDSTPKVLDALKAQAAPATFFIIGNKISRHPELVRRELAEGNEIGNHSWDHAFFTKLPPDKIREELDKTSAAFRDAGVPVPRIVRVPYGATNRTVLDTVKEPIILWNTDPKDWSVQTNLSQQTAAVVASVHPGSIIVLHDIKPGTAAALPELIRELRKAGYKLVTVSQLLELNASSSGVYYGR